MKNYKKIIAAVLVVAIVASCAVGATLAWLQDTTKTVTNTFSPSTIDIELDETVNPNFDMVPGAELKKDPTVTVKANSEACWLFVKVVESTDPKLTDYITYSVDSAWTLVPGETNVYYMQVAEMDENQDFAVLANDKVAVNENVTNDMMKALATEGAKQPTLSFTAYAIQQVEFASAELAWAGIDK